MKRAHIVYLSMFFLVSCTTRSCQSCNRDMQFSARDYDIKMWSGDSLVFHDKFHGVINQEEHSDGIFYFKGDTMKEIGGNYVIISEK